VEREVYLMFGGDGSVLENAMYECINRENYKNQLGRGIADVLDTMAIYINRYGYATTPTVPAPAKSFDNQSAMTIAPATVEKAIAQFPEETGINIAVVVEDATDVLETSYAPMIMGFIVAGVLIAVAIVLIVKGVRGNKRGNGPRGGNYGGGYRGGSNFYNDSGYGRW
jgi:hypothetical protein